MQVEMENMGMNVFVISFCARREMDWDRVNGHIHV